MLGNPDSQGNVGANVKAISLPTAVVSGKKTMGDTTAEAIGNSTPLVSGITITADKNNSGTVYLGATGVTSANGYALEAGLSAFAEIDDVSKVFMRGSAAGQIITYFGS